MIRAARQMKDRYIKLRNQDGHKWNIYIYTFIPRQFPLLYKEFAQGCARKMKAGSPVLYLPHKFSVSALQCTIRLFCPGYLIFTKRVVPSAEMCRTARTGQPLRVTGVSHKDKCFFNIIYVWSVSSSPLQDKILSVPQADKDTGRHGATEIL